MSQGIFRKVSLERLSSPEQLDQLFRVTTPKSWFALLAVGCLLAAVIFWSILGSIPIKVRGNGMLIKGGGIARIIHPAGGQVTDIGVRDGDRVKKGDVVARVSQPELVSKINRLQSQVIHRESSQEPAGVKQEISKLRDELEFKSEVVAPVTGRVLEVKLSRGEVIQPGAEIASVEPEGNNTVMELVMYVPAEEGKKIKPGMEAQVSPSTVNKEEYGYMLGTVTFVGDYPSTRRGMMSVLDNESLVSELAGKGAPLEVRVSIIPDQSTASGYKWSSSQGPPQKINSGTLCSGAVVIDRQRPMEMVVPAVKKAVFN